VCHRVSKGYQFNYRPRCEVIMQIPGPSARFYAYWCPAYRCRSKEAWVTRLFGHSRRKSTRPIRCCADKRAHRRLAQKRVRGSYIVVPDTISTVASVDHAHNRRIGRRDLGCGYRKSGDVGQSTFDIILRTYALLLIQAKGGRHR
jgi:hypothetical protein